MVKRPGTNFDKSICSLACAIRELTEQRKIEFAWMRSHHGFATQRDLDKMENRLMEVLEQLEEQVKKNTEVVGSAVVLIKGLADKIEASKTDPVKLQALANELRSSSTILGEAIVTNTPVDPDPVDPVVGQQRKAKK